MNTFSFFHNSKSISSRMDAFTGLGKVWFHFNWIKQASSLSTIDAKVSERKKLELSFFFHQRIRKVCAALYSFYFFPTHSFSEFFIRLFADSISLLYKSTKLNGEFRIKLAIWMRDVKSEQMRIFYSSLRSWSS